MLRAALKHVNWMLAEVDELGCTTYNAACGIETAGGVDGGIPCGALHHISCCVRH